MRQQVLGCSQAAERVHSSQAPVVDGGARQPHHKRVQGAGTAQGRTDDFSQTGGAALQRLLGRLIGIRGKRQETGGVQEPGARLCGVPAPGS